MAQGDGRAERVGYWSEIVIGACIEVHRHLGPGLLESAYEACLCHELETGLKLESAYRLDLAIEEQLVVEIKAVERLMPIHEAQLITYLKLSGFDTGLLVNFHTRLLKNGLRRLTRTLSRPPASL